MAAVLRVNLCKAKHFRVCELSAELLLYAVEVFNLGGREGEAFLLVVALKVGDVLDRSGLNVDGEDFLVETIVHALQHGVVFRLFALYGEVLLNTRNAVEIHILGNLYGIGAPRSNHFTARSYIPTLQLATFF